MIGTQQTDITMSALFIPEPSYNFSGFKYASYNYVLRLAF